MNQPTPTHTRGVYSRMPKRPRRTMAEYKKDVQEARTRRKLQESENRKRLKKNGECHMIKTQNVLMGFTECNSLSGMKCDVKYTNCDVDTYRGVEFTSYDGEFKPRDVNYTPSGGLEYTSDKTDCLLCDGVQASAPAMCAIIIDEDTMADNA